MAHIAFAISGRYGQKKDWGNVAKRLGGAMRQIDSKATLDVRVQAHALMGRALKESKKNAGNEYGAVVKLWADPSKAVAEIEKGEGDKQRRVGRALEAVGESLFYFAEQKKAKVDAVKFPAFQGPATKDEVLKHINVKVKDWIGKKKPLIDEATKEYKKIVDLQPVPPPRWVIAAGSQVGNMWGTFVDEFRAAPIPDTIKKDYELRTAYYGALDDASEPQKKVARGAFETCLGYSVKHQYFDEFSRECEKWLAKTYKTEYALIDEFRGAPTRVNSVLNEQAFPLRIGGEPMVTVAPPPEPPAPKKATDEPKKDDKKGGKK